MSDRMRLAVYGTLREGERLSFLLPGCEREVIELDGFCMVDRGRAPVAFRGDGSITVEVCAFDRCRFCERLLLFLLDAVEGVWLGRYTRDRVSTPVGEAWMYVSPGPVEGERISDWKKR